MIFALSRADDRPGWLVTYIINDDRIDAAINAGDDTLDEVSDVRLSQLAASFFEMLGQTGEPPELRKDELLTTLSLLCRGSTLREKIATAVTTGSEPAVLILVRDDGNLWASAYGSVERLNKELVVFKGRHWRKRALKLLADAGDCFEVSIYDSRSHPINGNELWVRLPHPDPDPPTGQGAAMARLFADAETKLLDGLARVAIQKTLAKHPTSATVELVIATARGLMIAEPRRWQVRPSTDDLKRIIIAQLATARMH
jgi:hypothetical protein